MKQDRNSLIISNMGLVYMVVRKLFPYDNYNDDLIQEGFLALCNAAKMFNENSGTLFSTYATCSIINAVKRAHYKEQRNNFNVIPVSSGDELNRLYNQTYENCFYRCEEKTESELLRKRIINILKEILTKKEFIVLCLYFGLTDTGSQMSASEIGLYFDVGDERIRQIIRASLKKIRSYLNK